VHLMQSANSDQVTAVTEAGALSATSSDTGHKRERLESVATKPLPKPLKIGRGITWPDEWLFGKPNTQERERNGEREERERRGRGQGENKRGEERLGR
jgi:hypothetical protein